LPCIIYRSRLRTNKSNIFHETKIGILIKLISFE